MSPPVLKTVPISDIMIGSRIRPTDPDVVAVFVESIGRIGLLQPLVVKPSGDKFVLGAGAHRLQALKDIGETEAPVNIIDSDASIAEIELAENRVRKQFSALETAEALIAEKAIYEARYPETAKGKYDREKHKGHGVLYDAPAFRSYSAQIMGMSPRNIQRYLRLDNIALPLRLKLAEYRPDVAHRLKELLKIAARQPDEHEEIIKALVDNTDLAVSDAIGNPAQTKNPIAISYARAHKSWGALDLIRRAEFLRKIAEDLPPGYVIITPKGELDE